MDVSTAVRVAPSEPTSPKAPQMLLTARPKG